MSDDISELFRRDPLLLTRDDIEVMVKKLREARKNFVLSGKAAPKERKAVDLKDLGLL